MSRPSLSLIALLCLLAPPSAHADATVLHVRCGGRGPLTSIGAALKLVDMHGPATIVVSGTCNENVLVQGLDRVTLQAAPGAAIVDPSGGTDDTLAVYDSQRFVVLGFQITGSVSCTSSSCSFGGNTIGGASGVVVVSRSQVNFSGDAMPQLFLFFSASVRAVGLTVEGSGEFGVHVGPGCLLDLGGGSVVRGNAGTGIHVDQGTLRLFGTAITHNGGSGVSLEAGARLNVGRITTITGNGDAGVGLGDLSFARFQGNSAQPNAVTGNAGAFDVTCRPQYPATRGALANIGGGTTNCVEP
jgi:hypothetical protein